MDIEQNIDAPEEDSIRGDLEKAFDAVEAPVAETQVKADRVRDDSGKFAKKSEELAEKVAPVVESVPEAPRSWTAEEKAKWAEATPEVRKAILRREQEVEQGFTKLDEDRNFGKSLKEIVQPYMQIINAEGGTPTTAIQSLLNTAYILRTAPVAQKTALFHQLAQQYGVDLSQPNNTQAVQPNALLAEINQLKQQIAQQPQVFQQQQETLAIKSKIDAFAADPKNVHYEKLKPVMASLLQAGQAKDMQDAYDKASWADPDIRSANLIAETQAKETQRIAEIKAKAGLSRKVAVSVRGSPSVNSIGNGKSNGVIADDIRAAMEEHGY